MLRETMLCEPFVLGRFEDESRMIGQSSSLGVPDQAPMGYAFQYTSIPAFLRG